MDGYRRYRDQFNKDTLFRAILFESVDRAWYGSNVNQNTWLEQWEFFLSKSEYQKFWLKKSQANRISRKLDRLIQLWFIERTGRRTGNSNASIYRLLPNDLISPPWEIGRASKNSEENTGNETGINKENIKENIKKREDDSLSDENKIIEKLQNINETEKIPFSYKDKDKRIDKLLSQEVYREILLPLIPKANKEMPQWELVVKIYKYAITNQKDQFWRGKISSLADLYKNLNKLASMLLNFKQQ